MAQEQICAVCGRAFSGKPYSSTDASIRFVGGSFGGEGTWICSKACKKRFMASEKAKPKRKGCLACLGRTFCCLCKCIWNNMPTT